ncbi:MAG TPA: alpha/beta hydrolase-fold protein [Steroidobacteraceae bacterium]|nr:alpha/beta hydrolase-fold protein [Steroidobacteraceae bacterium]
MRLLSLALIAALPLTAPLATAAPRAPSPSVVETRVLESTVLKDNRVGLNTSRRLKIYLPPGYRESKARYPVIYLLHSINWDNERMFAPGTLAQPTFDRAIAAGIIGPFIVVAPDYTAPGVGSFFVNSSTTGRFEDYTLQEVVPFVDSNYRTLADAASRGITGDFMGAYGAMRYAFRHPDVFGTVYGMHPVGAGSGVEPTFSRPDWALMQRARSWDELRGDGYATVFMSMMQAFLPDAERPPFYCDFMVDVRDGRRVVNARNVDLLKSRFFLEKIAAQERENVLKLRGIKFDWGRYDPTFAHVHSNRELTRELDELGVEHEAEEYRGLPWDKYWAEDGGRMATEVLPFFARHLAGGARSGDAGSGNRAH